MQIQFERTGGSNGTDYAEIDKILSMSVDERNEFLDRMIKEKKIAYLNPMNGRMITLPKN